MRITSGARPASTGTLSILMKAFPLTRPSRALLTPGLIVAMFAMPSGVGICGTPLRAVVRRGCVVPLREQGEGSVGAMRFGGAYAIRPAEFKWYFGMFNFPCFSAPMKLRQTL